MSNVTRGKVQIPAEASNWRSRLIWWAWLALLMVVPVTSFPLVEATIGGETVSPLSIVPLLLIVALWLTPRIVRGGSLPAELAPLLLFILLAFLATSASLLLPIEPYKGQSVLSRSIRGLGTLAVGLAFYLTAALLPRGEGQVTASLRALYAGALAAFIWSAVQSSYVLTGIENVPWDLNQIHRIFSVRDLFRDRITGLAYEPSWLGNQMVVLYLPLWIGSLIAGRSVFRKIGKFPIVEAALALLGMSALILAKSRISILGLLVTLGILFSLGLVKAGQAALRRLRGRFSGDLAAPWWLSGGAVVLIAAITLAGLAVVVVQVGSQLDWRMRRVATLPDQLSALRNENPYELGYAVADRLAFAERVVYWRAGFEAFNYAPVLGVGVGNSGFFFEQGLPAYAYRLTEIRIALDALNQSFPNPKSLWVRLLAETGVAGTSAYVSWMLVLAVGAWSLARSSRGLARVMGLAGLLALPIWFLEGFSLDTFALPQGWIVFGLVTGQLWQARLLSSRSAGSE